MRLQINTGLKKISNDLKALYVLDYALSNLSSKRMIKANLQFIVDRYGYRLVDK